MKTMKRKGFDTKIALILKKINECKSEKNDDVAVKSLKISETYEELGRLCTRAGKKNGAAKAFKSAEKYDMKFIRSEFSYDKALMKRTLKERKAHWKNIIKN